MKIQLVIQETTAGLNNQFVSDGLDIQNESVKSSLKDERMLAAQIANQSVVYSVQNLDKLKVYSAIYTDITDFTGRSGYFSIKIYTPKFTHIGNLLSLFNQLKETYLRFKTNNQITHQNYDSILANANFQENGTVIGAKSEKTYYATYNDDQDVQKALNNLQVYAIDKLYLFDAHKALKSEVIESQGLINFASLSNKLDYISVDNSHEILKSLIIGERKFSLSKFPILFSIFREGNEKIEYFTTDNNEKQSGIVQHQKLVIHKRKPAPVINTGFDKGHSTYQNYPQPARKKSFLERYQILLLFLFVVFAGSLSYYLFLYKEDEANQDNLPVENLVQEDTTNLASNDSSVFHFVLIEDQPDGYKFYSSQFNKEIDERYFGVKLDDINAGCFVIKQENLKNGKSPGILEKDHIKILNIQNTDTIEIFIRELEDVCGCEIRNIEGEPKIEQPKASVSSPQKEKPKKPEKTNESGDKLDADKI